MPMRRCGSDCRRRRGLRRRSSKINREANNALQAADVRARFAQWGLEVAGGTPQEFGAAIKAEVDKINALLRANALQVQ